MKITFKQLLERWSAPTPEFWKSVRRKMIRTAAAFAALGSGILAIEGLPEWSYMLAEYSVKIGAVAPLLVAFVASLTVDDGAI